MIQRISFPRLAALARPRLVKRAALFTGGAVTGMAVSVVASYAVVSTFVPRGPHFVAQPPLAAALSLADPDPTPAARPSVTYAAFVAPLPAPVEGPAIVALPVSADPSEVIRLPEVHSAPAPVVIARAPLPRALPEASEAPVPRPEAAIVPADRILPLAPEAEARVAVAPEAVIDLIPHRPDLVPPARPATIAASLSGLPARAVMRPLARPGPEISPEAFAALSQGDATSRAGATIGFGAAGPETAAVTTPEAVTLAALDTAPQAALSDLPRLRPMPRPDGLIEAVFVQTEAPAAAVPGIRPEPRPEVIRVASAAAAPAQPAPEAAAPRSRTASGICGRDLARAMPNRRSGSSVGSSFFAGLGGLSGTERDNQVIAELGRGNMPGFLRDLHPVRFSGQDSRGGAAEIIICVTPDYLALGSDADFVRVPLGLPAAARIAGAFDMSLPTPRMVDAIYAQADVHLNPAPMTPGPQMSSTPYLLQHNATIQGQLRGRAGLVAGQKKDVVMANRMASAPGRVAIYGWHRSNTSPIQPVSTVHQASYADYSHGIRLVSRTAFLNGRAVDLDDLLTSARYAYLLNSEGPIPGPVIRIASR